MQGDVDGASVDAALTERIERILSEIDESDFERIEPPADLWARIRGAITADPALAPKEPPFRAAASNAGVEYWIDADDVVTDVGQRWAAFARDNSAPELAVPAPDRTLWSYFDHDEIRELWQLLVSRVRTLRRPATVPLRCDAPHARRWFELTVTPEADGRVHFRSVLAFEEDRPAVRLLDPGCERDDRAEPVQLCSWCGRGRHGDTWLDIEELVRATRLLESESLPPISNGVCGACRDEMSAELLVPAVAGESPR
jgi:hypothetical protein